MQTGPCPGEKEDGRADVTESMGNGKVKGKKKKKKKKVSWGGVEVRIFEAEDEEEGGAVAGG